MATKKKKYPKKPKASASVRTLQNYIQKCKDVDKFNSQILSEKKKKEGLLKKISGIKK